jgi:hypothetical protein
VLRTGRGRFAPIRTLRSRSSPGRTRFMHRRRSDHLLLQVFGSGDHRRVDAGEPTAPITIPPVCKSLQWLGSLVCGLGQCSNGCRRPSLNASTVRSRCAAEVASVRAGGGERGDCPSARCSMGDGSRSIDSLARSSRGRGRRRWSRRQRTWRRRTLVERRHRCCVHLWRWKPSSSSVLARCSARRGAHP